MRLATSVLLAAVLGLGALGGTATAGSSLRDQLQRPQAALPVALPDGRVLRFDTVVEDLGRGTTGVHGRSRDGARLIGFTGGDGSVRADVFASGGRFELDGSAGTATWRRARPEGPLPAEHVPPPASVRRAGAPTAPPRPDGITEVDLLVLYTSRYVDGFGGDEAAAVALVQEAVFNANAYFAASDVPVRYRLVGLEPYVTEQVYASYGFEREAGVRARRDALGADLVTLVEGGENCEGQARVFNGSRQTTDAGEPQHVDPEAHAWSFVVLQPPSECRFTDWLLAHELGHNLGGGHDPQNGSFGALPYVQATPVWHVGGGYWKEFAHGVRCGDAGGGGAFKYASIMAYGLETQARGTDVRGFFFSSPDIVLDGERCGAEGTPGVEATRADNVRSITLAAPYVAAYREPVVP